MRRSACGLVAHPMVIYFLVRPEPAKFMPIRSQGSDTYPVRMYFCGKKLKN
jgi:hypothetical protein